MKTKESMRAPWHFWTLSVLMLLYSAAAAFDHGLSVVQGESYYALTGMTQAQAAYFKALPTWVSLAQTVSVWSGLAGAVLLLLRQRVAAIFLAASLVGTLGWIIYGYMLTDGRSAMGDLWFMPAVIAVFTLIMIAYSAALRRRSVLR